MNLEAVGTDVLPNVYIDRIEIFDEYIEVSLKMYDHAHPNQSWRNRRIDPYQLNVVCSMVMDYEISQDLNSGSSLIFDHQQGDSVIHRFRECNEFAVGEQVNDDYYSYTKTIRFDLMTNANIMYVYAACYVEGFSFLEEDYQKIIGPLSGEKIMENGRVVTESGYFYTENSNEEYGGPVHIDPSSIESEVRYMQGSVHNNKSHGYLYYVPQENFKVIDYRNLWWINQFQ